MIRFSTQTGKRLFPILFVLLIAANLQACALWKKPAPQPSMPDAKGMVEKIQQDFEALGQFKGISRFSQERNGVLLSGRAAFGAAPPDRLRVDILNPFGQPVVRLAYNGKHLYMYTGAENKFRSGVATRSKMNKALGIDLAIKELAYVLAGFPPIADHSQVAIEPWSFADGTSNQGYVLTLTSFLGRMREKIWVSRDGLTVLQADIYGSGKVLYSVFPPTAGKGGKTRVLGGDGASLILERQRFWDNATVDESQFMLNNSMVESR
ncbi:MAG: hypothetical protein JEZ02_15270 [Desulfatibacillum sp.]|nr:hypothetical protein [Desulfatibacillum sp.]